MVVVCVGDCVVADTGSHQSSDEVVDVVVGVGGGAGAHYSSDGVAGVVVFNDEINFNKISIFLRVSI